MHQFRICVLVCLAGLLWNVPIYAQRAFRPGALTQPISVDVQGIRDAYDNLAYDFVYTNIGTIDLIIDSVLIQTVLIRSDGSITGPYSNTTAYGALPRILKKDSLWSLDSGQSSRDLLYDVGLLSSLLPSWDELVSLRKTSSQSVLALFLVVYCTAEDSLIIDSTDIGLDRLGSKRFSSHFLTFLPETLPIQKGNLVELWIANHLPA